MGNVIQIKGSTTNTVPVSVAGANSATTGELVYSYRGADGLGSESGDGKLYIGHADGLGSGRSANVIGGSVFMDMLDHTAGTATASSALVVDTNLHTDAIKTTGLYLGSTGAAVLVTATAADLNLLDGVTASTIKLNYVDVTPGTATASKAVVLDTNSHIDTMKMTNLYIGASGSATQVTSSATELNLLDGITAIDTDLSTVAGTHTTLASALATKTYVDNTRSGLEVKDSSVVATTANLAATYSNGTSGVGATLTNSGSQAALLIDGVTLASAERVLVKDQTATEQNGIYQVTTVGNGSTNWVLTRTTDADTASEFSSGVFFFVEKGSSNADNGYVMTQDTAINFGTTAIIFSQFSGAGQITAGDGLAKSSNTLSVNTSTGITITNDNVVIDTTWTGQTAITTVGTIGTGTWNATAISATKGGTGLDTSSSTGVGIVTSGTWTTPSQLTVGFGGTGASTFTSNGVLYGNAAGAIQVTAAGTNGYFLQATGSSTAPAWTNVIDGGTF